MEELRLPISESLDVGVLSTAWMMGVVAILDQDIHLSSLLTGLAF
jgi:hypothetical protein